MKFRHYVTGWAWTILICFGMFFTAVGISQLPGCDGFGQEDTTILQATYDESVLLIEGAAAEAKKLRDKPDLTPEESAQLAKHEATIAFLQAALKKALNAEGEVTPASGLTALTTLIPPPWNVPSGLLMGAVGAWMKGRKTRTSFKRLVEAINIVKAKVPSFASSMDAVGPQLKDAMGEKVSAVVDKARKEGKFPVA